MEARMATTAQARDMDSRGTPVRYTRHTGRSAPPKTRFDGHVARHVYTVLPPYAVRTESILSSPKDLAQANQPFHNKYPLPNYRMLNIYFQTNLVKLARRMNLRQQALATAQVYIKRYYLEVEIRRSNPYLIMTTAVYLACKMEECPLHIRVMLGEAARQWPELGVAESSKIGECEFALISTLSSRLILLFSLP